MSHINIEKNKLISSHCHGDKDTDLIEKSIGLAFLDVAKKYANKTALVEGLPEHSERRSWSYEEISSSAETIAIALLEMFESGERIAVWGANSPEWVLLELGASLAGLVLVTVNPAYVGDELKHVLNQSQVRGVFVQNSFRGRDLLAVLEEVKPELPHLEVVIPLFGWEAFNRDYQDNDLPYVQFDSMAQIQYTSGTTGFPKGACLSHVGLANNSRFYALSIGACKSDVWVNAMPLFHTAGCGLATLGALQTGGTHILAPEFDAGLMLDLFEQEGGTIMLCVPTMLIRIIEEQQKKPRDLSTWRVVTLGGAPVPVDLIRRAEDVLGVKVAIGFGQTETSPYLTHTSVNDEHPNWYETVGKPLPHTELKIIDVNSGDTLPVGESGEICAKGYGLMIGYFNNDEATKATIDNDGWLHTGDIGMIDEFGYCRVHGRLKDMIIRGGENIYPKEIEDVLFAHPLVSNVAVIGLPDNDWGEKLACCVVLHSIDAVSTHDLEGFCRKNLASFKVPREWFFLDALPQTASGKVQKFVLRDQILDQSFA